MLIVTGIGRKTSEHRTKGEHARHTGMNMVYNFQVLIFKF